MQQGFSSSRSSSRAEIAERSWSCSVQTRTGAQGTPCSCGGHGHRLTLDGGADEEVLVASQLLSMSLSPAQNEGLPLPPLP